MFELFTVPLIYLILLAAVSFVAGAYAERWSVRWLLKRKHEKIETQWNSFVHFNTTEPDLHGEYITHEALDEAMKQFPKGYTSVSYIQSLPIIHTDGYQMTQEQQQAMSDGLLDMAKKSYVLPNIETDNTTHSNSPTPFWGDE